MRRFMVIVAGLAVIPCSVACQHTSGKCDCAPIVAPCYKYGLYTNDSSNAQTEVPKAEALPPAKMPGRVGGI
jgi:hypothetical protein